MATNSLTCLPFAVESDSPCPAIWAGLGDLLVNNRSQKVMGFQQVLWECLLSAGSYLDTRSPCCEEPTPHGKDTWRCSGQQPQLSAAFKSLQPKWCVSEEASRWPQPPAIRVFPSRLGLPSSSPRHCGAKTSYPCCALTEFLTRRICEHNKMAVVSHH